MFKFEIWFVKKMFSFKNCLNYDFLTIQILKLHSNFKIVQVYKKFEF
jgi:hypothetical protein